MQEKFRCETRMITPCTLPSLDTLLRDIRHGLRPPLYWGRVDTLSVPVVRCRVCGTSRPDDGTRCRTPTGPHPNDTCGVYQHTDIQTRYERWLRNPHEDATAYADRFGTLHNGFTPKNW